jgi:hypothetical protein
MLTVYLIFCIDFVSFLLQFSVLFVQPFENLAFFLPSSGETQADCV